MRRQVASLEEMATTGAPGRAELTVAADMPLIAKKAGAKLVEINPEDTPMSEIYDQCMRTTATEALATLCEGVEVRTRIGRQV